MTDAERAVRAVYPVAACWRELLAGGYYILGFDTTLDEDTLRPKRRGHWIVQVAYRPDGSLARVVGRWVPGWRA